MSWTLTNHETMWSTSCTLDQDQGCTNINSIISTTVEMKTFANLSSTQAMKNSRCTNINSITSTTVEMKTFANLSSTQAMKNSRCTNIVIYWIMILTYKYRFVVLLCIRSFVTYSWLCNMNVHSWMKVSIYMDKCICDNVFGYEVSTWVHGWSCEVVYDGKCDTGRAQAAQTHESSCLACGAYVRCRDFGGYVS